MTRLDCALWDTTENEAIYVGDTQGDYDATILAGIPFVFAKYGFGSIKNSYFAINEIKELLNLLGKLPSDCF